MSDDEVDESFLGRPMLEALGLNTMELLEATCDRLNRQVDAEDILMSQEYERGTIARVMYTGLFQILESRMTVI